MNGTEPDSRGRTPVSTFRPEQGKPVYYREVVQEIAKIQADDDRSLKIQSGLFDTQALTPKVTIPHPFGFNPPPIASSGGSYLVNPYIRFQ